MWINALEYK